MKAKLLDQLEPINHELVKSVSEQVSEFMRAFKLELISKDCYLVNFKIPMWLPTCFYRINFSDSLFPNMFVMLAPGGDIGMGPFDFVNISVHSTYYFAVIGLTSLNISAQQSEKVYFRLI